MERYQQGFNDYLVYGEPDDRLVDIPEYMEGFMVAQFESDLSDLSEWKREFSDTDAYELQNFIDNL